jgi:hypothetical protein
MAITGPSSHIPTINEFLSHWAACNTALPPVSPFLLPLPATNTTIPHSQFVTLRDSLQAQHGVVQDKRQNVIIARAKRNRIQNEAYPIMMAYRESLPGSSVVQRPANVELLAA